MTANVSEPEIISLQEDGASVEAFAAPENGPEIPHHHQARNIQGQRQEESNIQNLMFVIYVAVQRLPVVCPSIAYAIYKICKNRLINELLIREFSGNSAKVKLVAHDEEVATRFLKLLHSRGLLHSMNEEMDKHIEEGTHGAHFHLIKLEYYEQKEVSTEELNLMKRSTAKLQAQYEKELRTKPRSSQKRPGAVAEIEATAAKRLTSDVTSTENGEPQSASSRSQTDQVELESRDSEARNTTSKENAQTLSTKLEDILEDAATLKDVTNFTHDKKFADACDVMKDQYKNQVALQIGYIIMFYVNLVMAKIYVKFPGLVRTLVKLIRCKVAPSSEEILSFSRKLYNKGENVQAILFCEIASSFYEQEKALKNVADGIADCVHLLAFICTNMLSSDSPEDIAIYKPFIKTHVTRAMRAMVKEILGTEYQDRVPWCLHYIECVLCSVEDWDYRETIILKAWDLKRELPGEEKKYKIFAILQNNLGHNYEQTSRYQLAKEHYQRAHDAYTEAEDMDDKERDENLKRCEENMDRVSNLISNVQE